jgi:uncharacterized membrane protein YphA (DoxX/SURF4 family)
MKALNPKLDWTFRGAIVLALLLVGIIPKVTGDPTMLANFQRWGYPDGFYRIIGFFESLGVILILIPRTARLGAGLVVALMLGALATHLRAAEYGFAPIPAIVGGLALWVGLSRSGAPARAR